VRKVFDFDYRVVVERRNGQLWIIEYGIGCYSLWLYEFRTVYIYSPYSFAGIGSKVVLPDRGQTCSIWDAIQL